MQGHVIRYAATSTSTDIDDRGILLDLYILTLPIAWEVSLCPLVDPPQVNSQFIFRPPQRRCLSHGARNPVPHFTARCHSSESGPEKPQKGPTANSMVSACPTPLPAWLADHDCQSPRNTSASPALSRWMDISQRTARKSRSTGSILWSIDIYGEAQFRLVRSISETLPLTYSSSSSLIQGGPCRSGCVCSAGYSDQLDSSSGC